MRFIGVVLACLLSFVAQASENVLVVHSYHQGFFWTDNFQRGLSESLDSHQIPNRVMYLDTKRLQTPEYLSQLESLFKTKLEQERFRAIVVSDNNALNLMQNLHEYVGDTPVIFGGINNYSPNLHRNLNATGVSENIDLDNNIRLIKKLQPKVNRIIVLTDYSVTGTAARSQIAEYLEKNPGDRKLIDSIVPESFDDLLHLAENLNDENSILFWVYFRDKQGRVIEEVAWQTLNERTNAPVYMAYNAGLGLGSVGGFMQDGFANGSLVGEILVEVISQPEGTPLPEPRPIRTHLKLDYHALQKWGMEDSFVLADTVLNKPKPYFVEYAQEIRLLLLTVFILLAVIGSLLYYMKRLKRSEIQAKQSQLLLESVFDQSYQFIGIVDRFGTLVSSNSKLQDLLYVKGGAYGRPLWQYRGWSDEAKATFKSYLEKPGQDGVARFEAELVRQHHGLSVLDVAMKPLPHEIGEACHFLLEAQDITARKATEHKLLTSEADFRHYYEKQPVMMMTLDENNRIQAVNRFAQELLSYSSTQMLGRKLEDFYAGSEELNARQVLLQPKPHHLSVWRREIEYTTANGFTIWVRENIRPLTETHQLLIVGEDISETQDLARQLAYQAQHDLLTGTYNRNFFEQQLQKAMVEVEGHFRTHAMLFLDLDQLKVINDTVGHEAGDEAIAFCAKLIQQVLPNNAILSRMGGDEFALLLRDCKKSDAIEVAQSIIDQLNLHPFIRDDLTLNISCSIGIRLIDHTAHSPQMVHAQADTACHAAKEEGRNRYQLYRLDDEEIKQREREMESVNLVHEALANQRLQLFAQRIKGLEDENEHQCYFEILVRLQDANGNYVSPGVFMPATERYNIAHLVDRYVIKQTLLWLDQHPEQAEHLDRVSINVSGQSIGNREFIASMKQALQDSQFPNEKICLEITETAAIHSIKQASQVFNELKSLGCLIALDDFGSGLSSFGYLKTLPVDIVKIDGIFVRDIDQNESDYIMVRSINDLAQQMGKVTVAEFVESPAVIERLCELGVNYGQGYNIGMPKPLGELVNDLVSEKMTCTT
ncbi:putative TWO COMPONENT HISTIDINE KINASE [Vibrio nigripulchritudo SFn27]|uniref:Putative TWO COMPONENT HISTIDINE KINASE n=1 Tax=Vibrio nigripulchritudo TaxID=28173 RepID=U4K9P9_9VIBR|nr:EAL domain-containing protein [Vibrio nigripulchritudo]CCN81211.1 putative TWO COMPONENT HISTIDINE KINASE [Vibrio nigripulchritudo BLFn1]CCN88177.1 putative TWO COMPONENT HISTIDINE KINASE [Vibrio nigripulchritudo SFn27]CCN96119.1 putative TWO COMPONENT HISTIDINE KINASE [Vibrio nigripulchritudo ENn2]CCO42353.1 putative TWO COMPONENT HISTIDINE KINASE [Vibrio nigripulchritudo SFn135]CCO53581.1 putative TWO COMPONENT HISTIDINE KINASE [Vibrio nigripulchritudo Wn13]